MESLDEALTFAKRLRAERFHDPDSVFVLDDATKTPIDLKASLQPETRASVEGNRRDTALTSLVTGVDAPSAAGIGVTRFGAFRVVILEPRALARFPNLGTERVVVGLHEDGAACPTCIGTSLELDRPATLAELFASIARAVHICDLRRQSDPAHGDGASAHERTA